MKKIIKSALIFMVLIFLVVLTFAPINVSAVGCLGGSCMNYMNKTNLLIWYPMDETGAVATLTSTEGTLNPATSCTNTPTGGQADPWGGTSAIDFEKDNSEYCVTDARHAELGFAGEYTLGIWLKWKTTGVEQNALNADGLASNNDYFLYLEAASNTNRWYYKSGSGLIIRTAALNTWQHIVMTRSATATKVYVDGILNVTGAGDATNIPDVALQIARQDASEGAMADAVITDVFVYDRAISAAEVLCAYNGTGCYNWGGSFSDPTPPNGTTNNTQIIINVSCLETGNVTLWFDNNSNPTTVIIDNEPSPADWTTNVTSSNTYHYRASCGGTLNSTTYVWTYDITDPAIVINSNNIFTAANATQYPYDQTINLNFTLSDNHDLYAFMINITGANGLVLFNFTNSSLLGTSYTYNNTLNVTTWPLDTLNVTIMTSDSHTSEYINPYKIEKQNKLIKFNTFEGNIIQLESEHRSIITEYKKNDRYEIEFDFQPDLLGNIPNKKTFILKSDQTLKYKSDDSGYIAHFVTPITFKDGKYMGNWIDFEGIEGEPVVKKKHEWFGFGDEYYEITFNTNLSKIKFHSIGGLNVLAEDYQYIHENITINSVSSLPTVPLIGVQIEGYCKATEGKSRNVSYYVNWFRNGSLFLESINISVNYTSGANSNVYNLSGSYVTYGTNWTLSCRAYSNGGLTPWVNSSLISPVEFSIDNCSASSGIGTNATILNISFFDEDSLSAMNITEIVGTFQLTHDSSKFINYTINFRNISNFQICAYPNTTFYVDAYLQHTGEKKERYYIINASVSYNISNVYIYNFADVTVAAGLSELTGIVKDSTYDAYQNIYVKMQRYYPEAYTWKTVQMDQADEFGTAIFYVVQNEEDYKFIFEEGRTEIYRTESVKFSCSSATECEQTFTLFIDKTTTVWTGMEGNIDYDDTNNLVIFTWSDPNGIASSVRFLVEKQAMNGIITICDSTQTSSSGSINCNVSGYSGTISARAYRAASPLSNWIVKIIEIATGNSLDEVLQSAGYVNEGAMLGSLMMMGIVAAGAMTGSAVLTVIFGMFGIIILAFLSLSSIFSIALVVCGILVGIIIIFIVRK